MHLHAFYRSKLFRVLNHLNNGCLLVNSSLESLCGAA